MSRPPYYTPMRSHRKGPAPRPAPSSIGLSLVASFDDLRRNCGLLSGSGAEAEMVRFARQTTNIVKRFRDCEVAREQTAALLKEKEKDVLGKEFKMKQARRMLEEERKARMAAEAGREELALQLQKLKEILLSGDGGRVNIDNETLERIRHIDTTAREVSPFKNNRLHPGGEREARMTTVDESVESLLDVSDLSFEETKDDFGESRVYAGNQQNNQMNNRYKKRRSSGKYEAAQKRRKSRSLGGAGKLEVLGENILTATTKVTVNKDGVHHAESIIEAVPVADLKKKARKSRESRGERRVTYNDQGEEFPPSAPPPEWNTTPYKSALCSPMVQRQYSNAGGIPNRPHVWVRKSVVMTEKCGPCGKRIGFGKKGLLCNNCNAFCHVECKDEVPKPCVVLTNRTPTGKMYGNVLADYTPVEPPMVPALLIHCIRELENRGLDEKGIYRIPGEEPVVIELLEKFHRGRGVPVLRDYRIHDIASTLKRFLRKLKEPVIPNSLRNVFINAASNPDTTDAEAAMYQAISELPRPNRDTLAFLILHLQKVSENPSCQMDIHNLSKIWGPTILGDGTLEREMITIDLANQQAVMGTLLNLNSDYWAKFLQCEQENLFPRLNTPEESGERNVHFPSEMKSAGIYKRTRSRQFMKNKQQYFQSPKLF